MSYLGKKDGVNYLCNSHGWHTNSLRANESTNPTTEFLFFPTLPQELQDVIWSYAIVPRVMLGGPIASNLTNWISTPKYHLVAKPYTPSILHACSASRSVALKSYKAVSQKSTSSVDRMIYINPEMDILAAYRFTGKRFIPLRLDDFQIEMAQIIGHLVCPMETWEGVVPISTNAQGALGNIPRYVLRLMYPRWQTDYLSLYGSLRSITIVDDATEILNKELATLLPALPLYGESPRADEGNGLSLNFLPGLTLDTCLGCKKNDDCVLAIPEWRRYLNERTNNHLGLKMLEIRLGHLRIKRTGVLDESA